jgi:tetratricopeptide (TPR) repeat protein
MPIRCLRLGLTRQTVPVSPSANAPVCMRSLSVNLSIVDSQLASKCLLCRAARLKRAWIACLSAAIALSAVWVTRAADSPGEALKKEFDAAKASVAAGDLAQAEAHYRNTLALGLRQLGNLSLSEGQYESATRNLDEAVKLTPDDADLQVEDAIAWFRRGDTKKARVMIEAVLAAHPDHARAHNVLGRIALFEGNPLGSIAELKTAVALQNDFETAYFLGISLLKAKKEAEASELFGKLQYSMGESAALHVLFGRAYLVTHYPGSGVKEFRKAIELDDKYPRAHSLLGYASLEFLGESGYPKARELFEQELKIQPNDYLTLVLLGITAVSLRDYSAAEAALLHAARVRPEGASPYLYLGEIYTARHQTKQAVAALEKYVSLVHNPEEYHRDLGRGYFLLAQGLLRLGNRQKDAQIALARSRELREAEFKYDQEHMFFDQEHQVDAQANPDEIESHTSDRIAEALEAGGAEEEKSTQSMTQGGMPEGVWSQPAAAPQSAESNAAKQYRAFAADVLASSYNDLGVMRAQVSKFAEAAEFFKQAATWKPDLPGVDRNWGLASYRAEKFSEAIAPLERQLTAHLDDSFVRQLLGLSYFAADNFPKTVEVLRPFTKNPPDDPGLLFAWGTALVRTRQPELAMGMFRRLLEQNASSPALHFLLGQAYAQQDDYPYALDELKKSVQLDPKLPEAHYYTGLVYLHQSDFNSAAQEFRAELELRPADAVTQYHLAFALLSQGDLGQAASLLREVVKAKPDYGLAYYELGRALLQQGDAPGAISNLETAKKLAPEYDATYFQLSQAYRRAGRMPEAQQALATYQKLIEESRLRKRKSLEAENP